MLHLSHDNRADVKEAFSLISRYLDDLLNIDNDYFDLMLGQIYQERTSTKQILIQIQRPCFLI